MSATDQAAFDFEAADQAAEDGEALIVDLDGYEGPLHVLLALARQQKVDLLQLSILDLAEQYLEFIRHARRAQFALAADYLVMAAWLAYLKSRLLLPKAEARAESEPEPEDMAAALAFRLAKLDAVRRAVDALKARPQLGRDVFVRGDPEAVRITSTRRLDGDLYALLKAYIDQSRRDADRRYRPPVPRAFALDDARQRLRGKLPELAVWTPLSAVAPFPRGAREDQPTRASYLASTLAAGLELVREGDLEARQLEAFADLYLRARALRLETFE